MVAALIVCLWMPEGKILKIAEGTLQYDIKL